MSSGGLLVQETTLFSPGESGLPLSVLILCILGLKVTDKCAGGQLVLRHQPLWQAARTLQLQNYFLISVSRTINYYWKMFLYNRSQTIIYMCVMHNQIGILFKDKFVWQICSVGLADVPSHNLCHDLNLKMWYLVVYRFCNYFFLYYILIGNALGLGLSQGWVWDGLALELYIYLYMRLWVKDGVGF